MSEAALKLELINQIMNLNGTSNLKRIEILIKSMNKEESIINKLNEPIRECIDIEVIKSNQNYQPINKDELFQKMDNLNLKESLDDLINMI